MKTPKRHYELTTMEHSAGERVWDRPQEEVSAQRWKRKNRVAQLKRSLHRYRDCTNLPFYCHELHAALRLQELKYPGKKATADDWDIHIRFLKTIHCHIWQAIHKAEAERDRLNAEYRSAKNATDQKS